MASREPGARLVRVVRWQPQTQRQVWQFAAGYGLISGSAYGAVTWHFDGMARGALGGLVFGGVGVIAYGVAIRHRLRKRQDAEWRSSGR